MRKFFDRTIVAISWLAWLGAILMTIFPPDRPWGPASKQSWADETWRGQALFALVFAPLGCLVRFYASLHLNKRMESLPLGTFAVNISGTLVLGMCFDLQHVGAGGKVGCQVLQGIMDGFCGCLTTVSTWVVELKGLRRRHAYRYGALSVGVAGAGLILIMGGLRWTKGFQEIVCEGKKVTN
jgi:protein CrcB